MEGLIPAFKEAIKKELDFTKSNITKGSCENYESYKELCGMIKAYEKSLFILSKEVKKYLEDEDYDE